MTAGATGIPCLAAGGGVILPRMTLRCCLVLLVGLSGCGGSGDDDAPDGGAAADAAPVDAPAAVCTCTAGEGCLIVDVTRTADTQFQPWVVWPAEADGVGTLVVAAVAGTTTIARETVDNADMTPADAHYVVDLGCVPAGAIGPRVFLDDNLNAMPTDVFSSDYRDSCLLDRQPTFNVTAAVENTAMLQLNNSCD